MKKDRTKLSVYHLWRAIYPMPLYQLIQGLVLSAAVFFLFSMGIGDGSLTTLMKVFPDITVVYLMISGVLSILLFGWIYHRDVQERKNRAIWEEHTHLGAGTILLIMLGGAGVALAGNQLVNLTPLMELSENYVETSEALSAGNAWLELFCVGVLMPVAEEVVMRGLVYGRLRDMMRPLPAILWSALFFGLFHGNLVQGVYATACGIYLGWIMERFRTIKATAVAHIAANAFITILSATAFYQEQYVNSVKFWVLTGIGVIALVVAIWKLREGYNIQDNLENDED